MVSILASVCNSVCPAQLPVHKTKAMKHHYRDPQPLPFSLSISVPSLSPNRWCRALLIFHYHFLNLVTSRVSDFHWSPAVLNPEGWGFSPSLFIAGATNQFTLGLKVSHCPDGIKSLFTSFPSFYFLWLPMFSFSPSFPPSLPEHPLLSATPLSQAYNHSYHSMLDS